MKIESVISTKSLWFVDIADLNPRGRNLYRVLIPVMQKRFGFTPPAEFDEQKGIRFTDGEFSPSQRPDDLIGVQAVVFSNGLMAETRTSTSDTDLFLERTLGQLAAEGLIAYRPEMIRRKEYASEYVSRLDHPVLCFPALNRASELISEYVYGAHATIAANSLTFDIDPGEPNRKLPFTLQRRVNEPLSKNLFYSHGPLSSDQHMSVLSAIDSAFEGGSSGQ